CRSNLICETPQRLVNWSLAADATRIPPFFQPYQLTFHNTSNAPGQTFIQPPSEVANLMTTLSDPYCEGEAVNENQLNLCIIDPDKNLDVMTDIRQAFTTPVNRIRYLGCRDLTI